MPGKLINGTLLHSKKGLFEYIFYLNKVLVPVCLMPYSLTHGGYITGSESSLWGSKVFLLFVTGL